MTYLEFLDTAGLRPKTVKMTKRSIQTFLDWLGDRPLSVETLAGYRDHLGGRRLSPNTRNLELLRVGGMVRWMRRRGADVPSLEEIGQALKSFRADKEPPRVLSRDEIQALATACQGSDTGRTVLALLVSGLRYNELMKLTPANMTEHGIEVTGANSKNRRGRVIPWFLIGKARPAFVLPFKIDRLDWDGIRKASGLDIPLKALRSTWVTYCAYSGKLPLVAVAKLAGHTMKVCEENYLGAPIFGLTGESVPEWMGLAVGS